MSAGTASANVRDSAPYICRGAFVCEGAFVEGNVVINEDTNVPIIRENDEFLNLSLTNHPVMGIEPTIGCVVLPGAIISATGKRKLTLEGGSVVEPLAEIRHDGDDIDAVLGRGNILRVGAVIESPQVGSNNIFGERSHLKKGVMVGSGCVVGPKLCIDGIELSDGSCASVVDSSPLSFVVLRPGDTLEKNRVLVKALLAALLGEGKRTLRKYHKFMPASDVA